MKELQEFLGTVNFLRHFLPGIASILVPTATPLAVVLKECQVGGEKTGGLTSV
jgi:hypothetical protein